LTTVDIQRLVRDRHLTTEEASLYREMHEQAELEKEDLIDHLKTSPPGFDSWEGLAEFRALVKAL
jgi:hypothetical protein